MSWGESDPYYNPDEFGLVIITELNAEEGYSFDKFVVWKAVKGGKAAPYYWGESAGCSCTSPFEGDSLEDLVKGTALQAISALKYYAEDTYNKEYISESEKVKAIEDIQLSRTVAVKIVKNEHN